MWSFVTQPGLATAIIDFTNDLSLLAVGLFGLVVLSAGLIAFTAIRQQVSQETKLVTETAPTPVDDREAA